MKIVTVEWDDICSKGGWLKTKDARSDFKVISTGFLIYRNKKELVLSQSKLLDEDVIADTLTIPNGVIRKVRTIAIVRKKK